MKSIRKRGKPNHTGRNGIDRFAMLPYKLLESKAYRSQTPTARALLVEMILLYNGDNNGSLYLSIRDAADRLGIVDTKAIQRAFNDLMAFGLIEMTQNSFFTVKSRDRSRARCWRLTWLAGPGKKAPDISCFDNEAEPKTNAHKRRELGLRALKAYKKALTSHRLPGVDSSTLDPFNPDNFKNR